MKHAARLYDDPVQEAGRIIADYMYKHKVYVIGKLARIATRGPWPQEIPNT